MSGSGNVPKRQKLGDDDTTNTASHDGPSQSETATGSSDSPWEVPPPFTMSLPPMSSNVTLIPSETLNFPETILPGLDISEVPLEPSTNLEFETFRMTSPERMLHSPPLLPSFPDQSLSIQRTQLQSSGTSDSGIFMVPVPAAQKLPICEAMETDHTLVPEDNQELKEGLGLTDSSLHEFATAQINEPGMETTRSSLNLHEAMDQSNIFTKKSDFAEIFNLPDQTFFEIDQEDKLSVTSDLEYDRFVDARDYFTVEDDPVLHPSSPENVFHDPDFVSEDQFESQSEEADTTPSEDPPIYNGAKITVSELAIAFLSLFLNNDISGELLGRILSFIQLILPESNKFFSSLHSFFQYFKHLKAPVNFIFYCSACLRSLDTKGSICPRCGPKGKVNYYLHLPIVPQIQALYSNPNFVEALSYRFNRKKIQENNIEDIYDGELYKSASDVLSHPHNTSLSWNTDGISLYNSSNFQIWPFYFTVNELPPHLRFKEEYMILGGLAFGYEKPACNLFLKPICQETEVLANGIDVKMPNCESPVNVKCIVLCGTCDALAKSAFMRMTNFNGFYGCPRCLAKGLYDAAGKVFIYPFEETLQERTLEGYRENLVELRASDSKEPVCGVKGPTYLFKMVSNFFLMSTAVDVMHNVYLGVCRQLFFLWFSKDFIKKVFGENAERKGLLEKLSEILCKMEAPHYMSRPTRSLLNVKHFKAAEFRTWLFCTALPLLKNHMTDLYFQHFKKLVCAIALLNQNSISIQDVELARCLLISFLCDFQELFTVRNMSFNVHCLQHLPDVVLALGPLWVSSCFGYESLNGRLARLVHGTRHAGLQIYSHLGLLRSLSSLVASVNSEEVKSFCRSMSSKSHQYKVAAKIQSRISILGSIVKEHVLPPNFNDALSSASPINANYFFFFRLEKHDYIYVAEDYGKGSRNSSCVKFKTGNGTFSYGCIKTFVKITECNCDVFCQHSGSHYALINRFNWAFPFNTLNSQVKINFILSCVISNDVLLVPIGDLDCVCFKISVDESQYLSVPLNYIELE